MEVQQGRTGAVGTCGRHGLHAHGVLAAHLHRPDLRGQGTLLTTSAEASAVCSQGTAAGQLKGHCTGRLVQTALVVEQRACAGARGWCAWVAERSGTRSHSTLAAPPASFPASPAGPLLPPPAVSPQGRGVVSREHSQRPAAQHKRAGTRCTEYYKGW